MQTRKPPATRTYPMRHPSAPWMIVGTVTVRDDRHTQPATRKVK